MSKPEQEQRTAEEIDRITNEIFETINPWVTEWVDSSRQEMLSDLRDTVASQFKVSAQEIIMSPEQVALSMRVAKSIAKILTEFGIHPYDAGRIAADHTLSLMRDINSSNIKLPIAGDPHKDREGGAIYTAEDAEAWFTRKENE